MDKEKLKGHMELLKKVGDFSKITQVREDEVTELEERLKAISF